MITYNKLVYDILETVTANKIVDDFDVDERYIIYLINNQRALWLKREYNTPGRKFNSSLIQSFCMDLELKDSNICPCDDIEGCDEFLVSKKELPIFLELHHKSAITKIGSPDLKNYFFSKVSYPRSVFAGSGRFNKKSLFPFLIENKLYIPIKSPEHKHIKRVNIMGILEDPTELVNYKNCDGQVCFDKDSYYPLNSGMIPFIKEQVIKQLLMKYEIPQDNTNDANSNPNKIIE